jgi:1-acyl-sn-glycerol-3-phosphate acyltransferase
MSPQYQEKQGIVIHTLLVCYSLYAWTVAIFIGICGLAVVLFIPSVWHRRVVVKMLARIGLFLSGIRCSSKNVDFIRQGDVQVLVSNHTSFLDVVVYTALLPAHVTFIAKKELEFSFLIGRFLRSIRTLFLERSNLRVGRKDLRSIERAVESGLTVLFFPEGTFVAEPGLRIFKAGAFRVAAATGTPVVPVAINGARRIFRDTNLLLRPGRVSIEVFEPRFLYKFDSTARDKARKLKMYARNTILQGIEESDATLIRDKPSESAEPHSSEELLQSLS